MALCLNSTHVADSIKSTLILAKKKKSQVEKKNLNPQSSTVSNGWFLAT